MSFSQLVREAVDMTSSVKWPNFTRIVAISHYMAPEQFRGKGWKASDQYALATVVYEWLCGTVPFSEGDWTQLDYQHNYQAVPSLRAFVPTLPTSCATRLLQS